MKKNRKKKLVIYENEHPLFFKAVLVQKKKSDNYNVGKVQFSDYFPFGHKSHIQMIYLKALRLVSLVEKDGEPDFDGLDDTVIDMAAYANQYYKDMKDGKLK